MPRVPTQDTFQVGQSVEQTTPAQAPLVSDQFDASLTALGGALENSGQKIASVQSEILKNANELRAQDAANRYMSQAMTLQHDPNIGFKYKVGEAAMPDPATGRSLEQTYSEQLVKTRDSIAADLVNPQQQALFNSKIAPINNQFRTAILDHEGEQYLKFNNSVRDGAISLATENIAQNPTDPKALTDGETSIKAAIFSKAQLTGMSATEATALTNKTVSAAYKKGFDNLISADDTQGAQMYLNLYGKKLTADDALAAHGVMYKAHDMNLEASSANVAFSAAFPQLQPTQTNIMHAITAQTESGNKETTASGATVTSPKGAQGVMQVMPKTNTDPGFGVTPAKDASPEERARVGRDYLDAMMSRYNNNPALAWAAYNGGPGKLDEAIAKAKKDGGDPLSYMPQETKDYVAKNMAALNNGVGAAQVQANAPTKEEVMNNAREYAKAHGANINTQDGAATRAGNLFDARAEATKAAELNGKKLAFQWIDANPKTPVSNMPMAIRQHVAPGDWNDVQSYGSKIFVGENVTNPAKFTEFMANDAALRKASWDQVYVQKQFLSDSDYQSMVTRKKSLEDTTSASYPTNVNSSAFNAAVASRTSAFGINDKKTTKAVDANASVTDQQNSAVYTYLHDYVRAQQEKAGKAFGQKEIETAVDSAFMQTVRIPDWFGSGGKTIPLLALKANQIPDNDIRKMREAGFLPRAAGDINEGQLLLSYFRWRQAGAPHNPK